MMSPIRYITQTMMTATKSILVYIHMTVTTLRTLTALKATIPFTAMILIIATSLNLATILITPMTLMIATTRTKVG